MARQPSARALRLLEKLQVPEEYRGLPAGIDHPSSLYSAPLAALILSRVEAGEPLSHIERDEGFPSRRTVLNWVYDMPEFALAYARARAIASHVVAEDAGHVWRGASPETHQVDRLKFDALRWYAEKLNPRTYGSKPEPPPDNPDNATADNERREVRRRLLAELGDMAKPAPLTISEDGKES